MNRAAFLWGRRAAMDLPAVARAAAGPAPSAPSWMRLSTSLEEVIARRQADLADYQDAAYAARYAATVDRVRQAELKAVPGRDDLAMAVARNLYKLMAYKDEYEVARLYARTGFERRIAEQFEGPARIVVHLAPPLLSRRDPDTGHLEKRAFGPWVLRAFAVLAEFKRLRGTALDVFGYTPERRAERQLIADYDGMLATILPTLSRSNHALAVELATIPDSIRGYGHIKDATLIAAKARQAALLDAYLHPAESATAAAE
jgi:indolepyruvate ferredoxin oxidoreductase